MSNILTAIKTIIENSNRDVLGDPEVAILNRANQMGAALEDYVKNAFADCLGADARVIKIARSKAFSYLGNDRNPPDAMLKNGDAIEIKKLTTLTTKQLQLNSSFPKNKLYSNNPKISQRCRDCEDWDEKDMIYVVGHVEEQVLKDIFFVYGDLYCDSHDVYEKVEYAITEGIESLEGVEKAETNELGRVNNVDHLSISDLRIRGMWLIKSPFNYFDYLTEGIVDYSFKLVALIPETKYSSFPDVEEFEDFCFDNGAIISDEEVEDPQNPANLIEAKLVVYYH